MQQLSGRHYVDSVLAPGEHAIRDQRQHWFGLVVRWGKTVVALVAAIVLLWLGGFLSPEGFLGTVRQFLGLVTAIIVVLVPLLGAWAYLQWDNDRDVLTNRRIVQVEGVVNKRAADSSLEKINDAVLTQGIVGRLVGYGDLDVLTAAESTISKMRFLKDSVGFKKDMLNAKHELELELSGGGRPTPPLRAPATFQVPPPAAAAAPPAAVPSGQAPRASAAVDAEDVTETLARLADLRDRGTITPAEFEQKKAELLSRL